VAGVKHTFSVNIADDASAIAAGMVLPSHWNAEHTLSGVASQTDLDAVSNAASVVSDALSVETAARVAKDDSLSNAVSVVSQALSVEIVDRVSADNALSNSISVAVASVSNLTSAHNALSNVVSAQSLGAHVGVSIATPTSLQVLKYNSAAAQWVNSADATGGAGGSATSTEVSAGDAAVSLQAASALSQALSTLSVIDAALSNAISNLTSAHNVLSNTVSDAQSAGDALSADVTSVKAVISNLNSAHNVLSNVVSNIISAGGAGVSVTSNELSAALAVSARAFSASGSATTSVKGLQSAINRLSNNLSNAMSAGSHVLSVISAIKSAVSGVSATSAGGGSATGLQAVVDALSNKISATGAGSQSVTSLEFVDLTSAHNALSNRVSANSGTGGGGSVTSTEVSAGDAAVSLQAASALSQALSTLSVTDAALSVRIDTQSQAISVISQQVSVLSQNVIDLISAHNVLSNRVSANSGVGGGGSVTSTEVSAGDAAVSLQAASALSQALSVLSVTDAALSVRGDSVWSAISVLRSVISARSTGDVSTHGMQSIVNALSSRIAAGGGSVTSTEVSAGDAAVSLQAASALSQALSTVSVAVAAVSAQAASAIASEISNRTSADNAVSNAASANAISIRNAQSIGGHANVSIASPTSTQVLKYNSAAAQWVNSADATVGGASVTSTELSAALAVSVRSFSASGSATTSVKGLQSALNQLSNSMSNAMSAGSHIKSVLSHTQSVVSHQGSVISHQGSVLSAASVDLASVKAVLSNLTSAHNVLSNAVSALSSEQDKGMVSVAQSVSAATLTNISGLSVSVSTGGVYQLDGVLKINRISAEQPVRLGLTFSAMAGIRGWIALGNSVVVMFDGDSASGSILISSISAGGLSTMAVINAIVEPSVVGTIQLQIATSATTNVNTVARGSYIRVFKIN
jgi:hypothetical protein